MATERTIEVAQRLQNQGRMVEAERVYRELLGEQPDAVAALEGLGVVLYHQGRAQEAAAVFARGVAIQPRSVLFHTNLGEALRTIRRFDEAMVHLRTAVSLAPASVPAWNSLGLVAFATGRHAAAEHAYRVAIELNPRFVRAHVNLANTLLARGRLAEANDALRTALQIEPNNPLALTNLARVLVDMRDPRLLVEAEAVARRAVALAPRRPRALATLAAVLGLQGRGDEAREYEERVRKLEPGQQPGTFEVRDSTETVAAVNGGAPSDHARAQARYAEGLGLLTEGRHEEAEACLRAAIERDPTLATAWVALATVHAERGDLDLSCQSARRALAIRPDLAEAYWRLATNLLGRVGVDEVNAMERLSLDESMCNNDRALLHFGLAAVLDRRGLYAPAAAQLDAANLHQSAGKFARGLTFNPDEHSAFIDRLIAHFTPEFLARGTGWGEPDPRPVFVVGFPRSGTTLTEQVLASHPQVEGVGELHDIRQIFQTLPEIVGEPLRDWFDALTLLQPSSVQAAARRYLGRLEALVPAGVARVVDKMPDNIYYLGLITFLFPRAKVIVCHRDPRDIALSCWQTDFRSCSWNNNWDHIARRLADYQRMLSHWQRVRPIPMFNLYYEDLVADLEHHARHLIEFVGLDWDPACLEFHSHKRVVRTPSLVQVRQPIHSGSAGRWRNYEPYLQGLFEAFERNGVELENDRGR